MRIPIYVAQNRRFPLDYFARARLATEKRKKGKLVTVVRGLPADKNDLPALLGQLKTACGAGGTIKEDLLEIQGDHLARVSELLRSLGYRVR